jgi:hypothetical protein
VEGGLGEAAAITCAAHFDFEDFAVEINHSNPATVVLLDVGTHPLKESLHSFFRGRLIDVIVIGGLIHA